MGAVNRSVYIHIRVKMTTLLLWVKWNREITSSDMEVTPHEHTTDRPDHLAQCAMCDVLKRIMELTEADKKKVAIFALSQTLNPEAFHGIVHVCLEPLRQIQ